MPSGKVCCNNLEKNLAHRSPVHGPPLPTSSYTWWVAEKRYSPEAMRKRLERKMVSRCLRKVSRTVRAAGRAMTRKWGLTCPALACPRRREDQGRRYVATCTVAP